MSKSAGSNNSTGTTHKIREQLNFTDEKKWKKFSSRRLELIDKFGLSERKASEQDDNIKQIATILRTEFGYSLSSTGEFEKLVTAAVQSVRRNRKRSKKRIPGSAGALTTTGSSEDEPATRAGSPLQHISTTPVIPQLGHTSAMIQPSPLISLPSIQPKPLGSPPPVSTPATAPGASQSSSFLGTQQRYNDVLKAVISDIVNSVVSLSEQSQRDQSNGPNLTDFALSANDQHLLSLGLYNKSSAGGSSQGKNSNDIPFFLREKLLLTIQRSRSCFDMAHSQGSMDLYSNLEILGEMSIRSSVAFVIERFFSNLMPSSMEYITSKTSTQESLSLLSTKIFGPATKRSLNHLPPTIQTKLLYLIVGGLIKDFGFDPCLYPLSEIVHHLIMNQYPLLANSLVLPQNGGSQSSTSQRTTILSTLSMKPQLANQDVNKKVVIKFKDREQIFTFHLLSNGPPTINEILENCKSLFQIVSQMKQLSLYHNNSMVHDDVELAKLFNSFSKENILLEVKETKADPSNDNDGLKILSDASLQIKQEVSPANSMAASSVDAFDKIINRIGKFPKNSDGSKQPIITASNLSSYQKNANDLPSLPSVVSNGSGGNNFLENDKLSQSAFQPLL